MDAAPRDTAPKDAARTDAARTDATRMDAGRPPHAAEAPERGPTPRDLLRPALVAVAALGLAAGIALHFAGRSDLAAWAWGASAAPVLGALIVEIVGSLRRGDYGLDVVAALSMSAALIFGETLAAAVVALMYAGGQYLESFAEGRARREMTALLARAPRTALRRRGDALEEVALDAVAPGDVLLVRRGDVVPVDGRVTAGVAVLDESALTGEAAPVRRAPGDETMSGPSNVGDAFEMVADRPAADSAYAGILRLVRSAQASKAPMVRLADRYAMVFLGLTVALAGAAWLLTGDPIRAVAVLVVATPCPLILAVPVALVAGVSRAASQGVLVKGARALEAMARVEALVLDKTGTLTDGRPALVGIETYDGRSPDAALRLAAALDQASRHPIAQAIVAEAAARGLDLPPPETIAETPGEGVAGRVDGREVVVGGPAYVTRTLGLPAEGAPQVEAWALAVSVGIDGRRAATISFADALRPGSAALLDGLRAIGVGRIVLATGDRAAVAEAVAENLPLSAVRAELTPEEKVLVVLEERRHGPVMMVGDGVNDAPALAAADVGVAMGARGAAASAEAADVVVLVDRLDRVLPALAVAKRARAIAYQSVAVGLGLSVAGMVAAAFGLITPVQGALLQEVIDVAAILNALRALRGGPPPVRT